MHFKIVERITNLELIASGKAIRERKRLWRSYGKGRWRKLKGIADVQFADGTIRHAEIHWYEAHGIGRKNTRSSGYSTDLRRHRQFVICVGNQGYSASLELRKIYQVVPDKNASALHQIRVIDESGEDYLYPEDCFVPIQLPQAIERAVRRTTA